MQEIRIPGAQGGALHVRAGQFVTIIDLEGSQVVDFVAFAEPDTDEFLSVTHAQVHLKRFLIGQGDTLVSNRRRPLFEIVRDDCGRHDMHYAMCDPERYRNYFDVTEPHRSCMQNFLEAFAANGFEITRGRLPNPINFNQNVATNDRGELELLPSLSKPGGHIVLRALADVHAAGSACPMDIGPINGGSSTDVLFRVSDTEAEGERLMKLGVIFPQAEDFDVSDLKDLALTAEDIGYDHLLCYDRQLGVNAQTWPEFDSPYGMDTPFHEPLTFFAFLAAVTSRIGFASDVIVTPTRGTVLLAKQAAEVQVLSGGRLRLGIGVGANRVSFDQAGADFRTRGAYCEEQVRVLRELWSKPEVEFAGRFHQLRGVGVSPRPDQSIPLWFGGDSPAVIDRIGRMGDGWFPYDEPDSANRARIERIHAVAREAGRDPAAIGIEPNGSGTPDELRARAEAWRAAGATHFAVNTMGRGLTADQHIAEWRQAFEALHTLA